jgi:hypothetical protein
MAPNPLSRRGFLGTSLAAGASLVAGRALAWDPTQGAPAIVTSERLRPLLPAACSRAT